MFGRIAWLTVLAASLGVVIPAHALFHVAEISEVMSGAEGDASVQFVEIRMDGALQNVVGQTQLVAFSCDGSSASVLLTVPANVANQGLDVRWLMATPNFAAAACITPDFTFPPGILSPCGMVCWGGGGGILPAPPTWDIMNLLNHVDCIAYGGYSGPTRLGSGTASALAPGDGNTQSLTRVNLGNNIVLTGNNSVDFVLAPATPKNNVAATGVLGGACPTVTTTSTSTSTTTTLPDLLTGAKLRLKDNPDAAKKAFSVQSKDPAITLGAGNASADDPILHGGSLRVRTTDGCGGPCDNTYPLPSGSAWTRKGKPGKNKGYVYKDKTLANGPIKGAAIAPGKVLKAAGKGGGLGHLLIADPGPVSVDIRLGDQHYCMTFGGTPTFVSGKKFSAVGAAAAPGCPP